MIAEVDLLRSEHPGCGVEKMYYTLKPDFIGRDRFIELFMDLGYRLKRYKDYRRTTFASRIYYPNLIKGLIVDKPSFIWQSDITYIDAGNQFYYAVFIIDVFTREIVGYQVSNHLRAAANVNALLTALGDHPAPYIHHSDRGSQYIYSEYISLLKSNNCKISMGLIAQENAYAERINRTIKDEYLRHWNPENYQQLKRMVDKAVKNYNQKRIHNAINRCTPKQLSMKYQLNQLDKKYDITIFNNKSS